ncbi:zinc-dependent peptidase [Planctomicrobium sp. SH527]|uniref:M90 family metallopeptidase n=1 Tax=Planctomicrobium sp. SH527 TaxID=3448123 RepID=UPI003F5C9B9D
MIFNWLKSRRRKRILTEPFPVEWDRLLSQAIWQYRNLTPEERTRLQQLTQVFVAEKNWEGCNGLQLQDLMKVIIAAYASLLVINLDYDEHFENVLSILIYPTTFVGKETTVVGKGLVLEGTQARIGEAWYRGPVVLSWSDIRQVTAQQSPGRNVVLHEFAHQLDMLNGRGVDGTPPMNTEEQLIRWQDVISSEFEQLAQSCRIGAPTFLDCYGATSPAEFFAVTTESFFESPRPMRHFHPTLYAIFCEYYRQSPAERAELH